MPRRTELSVRRDESAIPIDASLAIALERRQKRLIKYKEAFAARLAQVRI